jgi:prophage DNA circulation protein
MAELDPNFSPASTPQTFTWQNRVLVGFLVAFDSSDARRSVTHEFPKRGGALEEDMGDGQRWIAVRLVFSGVDCAKDCAELKAAIKRNPVGLLIHPTEGKWLAFCRGLQQRVAYQQALDHIEATAIFAETQLDAGSDDSPLDVATAVQNADGELLTMETETSTFMVKLAEAQTTVSSKLRKLDEISAQISTATSPIEFVRGAVNQTMGGFSRVIGAVNNVAAAALLLKQDVQSYLAQAADVFSGGDIAAASTGTLDTLLSAVLKDSQALEDTLVASSPTPAGAGDAVAAVEVSTESCLTVQDAVNAALPPLVEYTVPATANIVVVAQRFISARSLNRDAAALAQQILGRNRVPNPAAIKAGTKLLIPTR